MFSIKFCIHLFRNVCASFLCQDVPLGLYVNKEQHLFCLQAARESWAETLWANLNIQILQDGIETFLKNLRKMPRDVKQMSAARTLEEKMKEFRDSLPLFVDLKHEALRDRYVV